MSAMLMLVDAFYHGHMIFTWILLRLFILFSTRSQLGSQQPERAGGGRREVHCDNILGAGARFRGFEKSRLTISSVMDDILTQSKASVPR